MKLSQFTNSNNTLIIVMLDSMWSHWYQYVKQKYAGNFKRYGNTSTLVWASSPICMSQVLINFIEQLGMSLYLVLSRFCNLFNIYLSILWMSQMTWYWHWQKNFNSLKKEKTLLLSGFSLRPAVLGLL